MKIVFPERYASWLPESNQKQIKNRLNKVSTPEAAVLAYYWLVWHDEATAPASRPAHYFQHSWRFYVFIKRFAA